MLTANAVVIVIHRFIDQNWKIIYLRNIKWFICDSTNENKNCDLIDLTTHALTHILQDEGSYFVWYLFLKHNYNTSLFTSGGMNVSSVILKKKYTSSSYIHQPINTGKF